MSKLPTLDELVDAVARAHPNGNALQNLTNALILSGQVTDLADELTGHFVEKARTAGATWAEIGQCMGVSKQAAQKRYRTPGPRRVGEGGFFFTRLADDARSVVRGAVSHAQEAGSEHVGTEHILAGIVDDPDSAGSLAIEAAGVSMADVRARLQSDTEHMPQRSRGHIPFSPESKKVLELSLREAIRTRSRRIDTGHILLAILREGSSPGALVLDDLGIEHGQVSKWLEAG